jgi:hypothetical protein
MIAYVRRGHSNLEEFVSIIINKAPETCLAQEKRKELTVLCGR